MMVRFQYVNYFLVLWNTVGAIILTFQGPYYATTNGVSFMQCVPQNVGKYSSQLDWKNVGEWLLLACIVPHLDINRPNSISIPSRLQHDTICNDQTRNVVFRNLGHGRLFRDGIQS